MDDQPNRTEARGEAPERDAVAKNARPQGGVHAWLRAVGVFRGFLIVSLIPVSVGTVLAYVETRQLDFAWLGVTMLAAWCFHAGANLLNDFFDHVSGTDDINEIITPFSGGTRVIQDGLLGAKAVRNAGWFAYLLGAALFAYLGRERGPAIWALAAVGSASGIAYTLRPIWLAYRGLGEFLIFLNFGPLLTVLGTYVQTGTMPVSSWVLGASLGLWSAAIITINEIPDLDADEEVGKRNLVVRFGADAGIRVWAAMLWASPVVVFLGMLSDVLPRHLAPATLIVFPIFFITRHSAERLEYIEDIVKSCRNTVLGLVGYWLLLVGSLFYVSHHP